MIATLIFPHQLFKDHAVLQGKNDLFLIEEFLFFNQYQFHKQKILFHRISMQKYLLYLKQLKLNVNYIEAQDSRSDIRELINVLKTKGYTKIQIIDPTDDWLLQRIEDAANKYELDVEKYPSPLFLNHNLDFFSPKKKYFQTSFYKKQRVSLQLLVDDQQKPEGGKWTFDAENRKPFPKKNIPPKVTYPKVDSFHKEGLEYTQLNYSKNPGSTNEFIYPTDHQEAQQWLDEFIEVRFEKFGDYEDAIIAQESILHHSLLSPLINVGLLTPKQVIEKVMVRSATIPINSLEGFIRQVIGWREFIRGVYEAKGRYERTHNYFGFIRKIPSSFYDGTTGIEPIDTTIKKVLKTGYCHHIERLMVLGNFMFLCEFDPDEVYRWFMELFIDAYDWVMVPNVYGMSQYADGGLMSTKPYFSGSNYVIKMSNYKKGKWSTIWDALFWRAVDKQREVLKQNPRLSLLIKKYDQMDDLKTTSINKTAEDYLSSLTPTP